MIGTSSEKNNFPRFFRQKYGNNSINLMGMAACKLWMRCWARMATLNKYFLLPTQTLGKIRTTLKNLVLFPYSGCWDSSKTSSKSGRVCTAIVERRAREVFLFQLNSKHDINSLIPYCWVRRNHLVP